MSKITHKMCFSAENYKQILISANYIISGAWFRYGDMRAYGPWQEKSHHVTIDSDYIISCLSFFPNDSSSGEIFGFVRITIKSKTFCLCSPFSE